MLAARLSQHWRHDHVVQVDQVLANLSLPCEGLFLEVSHRVNRQEKIESQSRMELLNLC